MKQYYQNGLLRLKYRPKKYISKAIFRVYQYYRTINSRHIDEPWANIEISITSYVDNLIEINTRPQDIAKKACAQYLDSSTHTL